MPASGRVCNALHACLSRRPLYGVRELRRRPLPGGRALRLALDPPAHGTCRVDRRPEYAAEGVGCSLCDRQKETNMKLEGIHHITAITGDAPGNVDFYAGVLGLRLVKKTVNQDDPTVYHLFYADEAGSPGADLTFFEYPGAGRGTPGAGMVHRIVWRVASEEALDFWADRLRTQGVEAVRKPGRLDFSDREGLDLSLQVA